MLEFYMYESELWYMKDGVNAKLDETKKDIISEMLNHIMECYPEAYKALAVIYEKSSCNVSYYQYLIVSRFCRCNFSELDTTHIDKTDDGVFNFEKVKCPLRGECKFEGVVCMPIFNNKLSQAEDRVMELWYKGYAIDGISEMLYLSPNTVKNHIKSAYHKLDIHDKAEFYKYAKKNNMYQD